MSKKNKRFHRNQKSQKVTDSKQATVNNLKSLEMDEFENNVKQIGCQTDYSDDVLDFIENPSMWSEPTKTPGYGLKCVTYKKSGSLLQGKFKAAATMLHWEFGEIFVSFGYPYIYPGQKKIYFPIKYLTADKKLYHEITIFDVDFEPTQQAVFKLYTALLFLTQYGVKSISEEKGWNTSFLLRPVMDALRAEVLKRQLVECNERLANITKKGATA